MTRGLLKSTAVVGTNTLASRVLGFVRDVVIARAFGAGAEADAFFVAFRIPNLFRRLFAEGAFSQAFVPVLSAEKAATGDDAVRDLVSHVSGALALVLFGVTAVGVLSAPVLVLVFAPGFHDQVDKFSLTVEMLRLCFPYLLFISLTSLCAGLLNSYGRFGIPAFTPVLLNVCLIAATLWLAPRMAEPVVALAWGVLLAGLVQLALQLIVLARLGLLVRPRLNLAHAGVRRIARLIVPALLGVSVAQINILVDTLIASFLENGSVSWLYYSDRIMEFPLGVFGIALATVILPSLSQEHARRSPERFSKTLDWALRWVVLIAVPASVGMAVLATPILATLFQHGEFRAADVHMASLSLTAFAVGLPGFVGVKVLAPGFYARQDMRTPVRIAAMAMLCNLVLNLALVGPLAHAGLALATAIAALLNAALLYRGLRRAAVHRPEPGWSWLLARVLIASAVMLGFLVGFGGVSDVWLDAALGWRIERLGVLVVGGMLTYVAILVLIGVRPASLSAPVANEE